MLMKHTLIYMASRGVTGVIGFLAIVIYSRILVPADYGLYSIVMATVWLFQSVFYRWINLGLVRFLQHFAEDKERRKFTSSLVALVAAATVVSGGVAGGLLLFPVFRGHRGVALLGIALLWALATYELNQDTFRSDLTPKRYGWQNLLKFVLSLGLSLLFVMAGWGAGGMIVGATLGMVITTICFLHPEWKSVRPHLVDPGVLRRLTGYGLPLVVTSAMGVVINNADRLLLGSLRGPVETGLFSIADDFTQQTLLLFMMVVNLAAFPLVVKATESGAQEQVRAELEKNVVLLFMVGVPATVGVILLMPNIGHVFIGNSFRASAASVIPVLAVATFFQGLQIYYFDLAFQIVQKTTSQVWPVTTAAVVNVGLNLWWIPKWGLQGCAYATIAAYFVGALMSWWVGRKVIHLPLPGMTILKIAGAAGFMAAAVIPLARYHGLLAMVVQVLVGVSSYGTAVILLNISEARPKARRIIAKWVWKGAA